jgi:hypothetical protein
MLFIHYKKVILMIVACFSKIIYHRSFWDPKVSGVSVCSHITSTCLFGITDSRKLKTGSQFHNIHTKFCENWLIGSKIERGEYTDSMVIS